MMLTRSLVAVVCGALAVASVPGQSQHFYEEYNQGDQWHAQVDGPRPGLPKPSFPPSPPGDYPPPHGPPPGMPKFPFPPPPKDEDDDEPPQESPHWPPGPPPPGPPHAPPHPKVDDKTIFQALGEDERFSRLYKLVNFTEDIVSILNDSSKSVTFFAVPNHHLRPPKPPARKHQTDTSFDEFGVEAFFGSDVIETSDEIELFSALEGFVDDQLLAITDDEKEKKKEFFKKILTAVLKYHILPEELPAHELAKNTTYPTSLTLGDGSLGSEALRLRVEQPPRLFKPTLSLNFYAKVVKANIKTNNGLIHVVNHPLFPPPSTFTTLFAFPDTFSIFSSAVQRAGLLHNIDWHWDHRSKSLAGSPAVTVFAPTNEAFKHLPPKLKLFLFSPPGHHVLKKILSYHIVPDYVLHTNWAVNASDDDVVSTFDQENIYGQIPNGFDGSDFDLGDELFGRTSDFSNAEGWTYNADGARAWDVPHAQPEYDGSGFPGGEYGPSQGPQFPPYPPPPFAHGPEGPQFPPPPPPPPCSGPFRAGPHGPHFPPPPFTHGPPGPPGPHSPRFPPPPFAHGARGPHCPPPPPHFAPGPQGPHFPPPPFSHGGTEGPHSPPPPPYYGQGPEDPGHHFPPHHGFDPKGPHFPPPPPRSCHGGAEGPHFPPPPFGHGPKGPHSPPPPFSQGPEGPHFPPPPFGRGPEGPNFPPPPSGHGSERPHFPPPPFGRGPEGPHCPPPPPPDFCLGGPQVPHLPPPPFGHGPASPRFPPPPFEAPLHHKFPPKPVYSANATLPTLLANHTLSVHVAQFRSVLPHRQYTTALFVNGQWVAAADVPARNGAVHVVRRLLHPKGPKPAPEARGVQADSPSWEDWEDWLPQWAEEA